VEKKLKERLKIPVFHDDQHGTAIIVGAAVINGLRIVKKDIDKVKLAGSGAGASAIACLELLVHLGMKRENIFISDSKGVIYEGRDENMVPSKAVLHRRQMPGSWMMSWKVQIFFLVCLDQGQ
jgi:malate dehydrogenase (oxaloacetate-decarboxylating)(NADP+)